MFCPIKSPSFQQLLMMSVHDLRFSSPLNSKSRLRLCIKPCAICIPDTGRGILVLLAHLHEWLLTTLQRCQQQNICCIASSLKFLWFGSMEWNVEENFSMEWNMEENFSMEWKIFGMEWKWNGRKLPVWNMEKSSSIPFHAMPCSLVGKWPSKTEEHATRASVVPVTNFLVFTLKS